MGSLSAHLRRPEQHARLPFHPECPMCREERLVGTLKPVGVISGRARAALAASVLAVSAVAPTASFSQEPDQVQEGVAAPDAPAGNDADNPEFDPGGPTTELPSEPAGPGDAPSPGEAVDPDGPLEPEPTTGAEAPIVDPGDEGEAGVAPSAPAPTPGPPPAEAPAAPEAPPTAAPGAQSPPTSPSPAPHKQPSGRDRARQKDGHPDRHSGRDGHPRHRERTASRASSTRAPGRPPIRPNEAEAITVSATPTAQAGTASRPAARTNDQRAAGAVRDRIGRGDRVYVVRPGDSLWSVAADRLGAAAGVAAIAREVNRLWERNRDQIGTGDPDLLGVGTRLKLR